MAIYNGGLSIKNVSVVGENTGNSAITSISPDGNVLTVNKATDLTVKGKLYIGGTSAYIAYNSTTESLDFVFT